MDKSLAQTALAGDAAPADLAIELAEAPLLGMVTVRGDLAAPAVAEAVQAALGVAIPAQRKVAIGNDGRRALWMAPDELMLQLPYEQADDAVVTIDRTLGDTPHLVANVSDARAMFVLKGECVRDVLAKGAPIDLHRDAFGVGDLRRTRISAVAAAIYQTHADPETFEVFCFRSYAAYLWDWLCASSKKEAMPDVLSGLS